MCRLAPLFALLSLAAAVLMVIVAIGYNDEESVFVLTLLALVFAVGAVLAAVTPRRR